jgi:hypothetical protein
MFLSTNMQDAAIFLSQAGVCPFQASLRPFLVRRFSAYFVSQRLIYYKKSSRFAANNKEFCNHSNHYRELKRSRNATPEQIFTVLTL